MYLVISICDRETAVLGKCAKFDKARELMAMDMMKQYNEMLNSEDDAPVTLEQVLSGELNEAYEFGIEEDSGWLNEDDDREFDWVIINLDEVGEVV